MLKLQNSLKTVCMAAAALTAWSCSQDDVTDHTGLTGNTTIVASFEGANTGTRTAVSDYNEILWNKDDAFGLFYTINSTTPNVCKFSCPNANGNSTTATFSGTLDDNVTTSYAVYPYDTKVSDDKKMSLDGTTVTMNLPNEFPYTTASNGPMYAVATDITQNISFKHLAGLLKLTISKGITADAKKFVITADKDIAGTFTADLNGENPVLTAKAGSTNSRTITVILSEVLNNEQGNSTTFYIPIPVNTYTTLSAKLVDNSDNDISATKEWKNITVARAGMLTSSFGFVTIDAETNTNEKIAEQIAAALPTENQATETTTDIQVSGTIDATETSGINEIAIPVYQNSNVNLSLDNVTTSKDEPLKIVDAANSDVEVSEEAINKVTIITPKGANLDINMHKSTVELDAVGTEEVIYNTGEVYDYDNVTSLTGKETLIIKKGITVNNLTVKGGNVRVAGTVNTISKGSETTPLYLIKEKGADIPTNAESEGFTVIDATVYDLMMAAKNGGMYVLDADVTLSKPLSVASTMTLDLNGHHIKPILTGLEKVGNTKDAVVLIHRGANLTIYDNSAGGNGSISTYNVGDGGQDVLAEGVVAAVKLTDGNDTGTDIAEVTVNSGIIQGGDYGITGNGTRHGTKITVNGGSVEALSDNGTAIYHPQEGTLNVTGGTISGYCTGIEIRSGELTVSGGSIACTATTFNEKPNDSGTTITGAAVAVSQHTTNLPLKVNISGGTLQGLYALYEKDLQDEDVSKISITDISGCIFNGSVFSENCKAFISSGNFSDPNALAYLKDGADVNIALDKDYSIPNINVAQRATVAMNLNQNTLTTTNNNTAAGLISGNLKITNGKLAGGTKGIALFAENAELELDNVNCTFPANSYGIFNDKNVQSSTIIVKSSTINSGYYGISTNASTNPVGTTTITLEKSTITADETALLVNIPSTVTVTGCTLTGGWQGVFLRGSTTTFTNCNINFKFDSSYGASSVASGASTWGQGNQAPSAALTMGNRSKSAYDYKTTVELINTKFSNSGDEGCANYPAIYIDAETKELKPNQGVKFTYDGNSYASFSAAGKGLVINQKDNVTASSATPI